MRYVIIRDDDTNALTPVDCLERLYRPFLDRGMPVNLAVIPDVATEATMPDGKPEGFLLRPNGSVGKKQSIAPACAATTLVSCGVSSGSPSDAPAEVSGDAERAQSGLNAFSELPATLPIGSNEKLVRYLLENPGYQVAQHGLHHKYLEFDRLATADVSRRLQRGTELLMNAGFSRPQTFVAPYDKLSRASLVEVAARFRVLSTGWFELRRLPLAWWPNYAWKKIRAAPHWRAGRTVLLSHPGCLLSCFRTPPTRLEDIRRVVNSQRLTVLVTHWWEYFRNHEPDQPFIDFLHETADYLAGDPEIRVISFSDLVKDDLALN